MTGRKHYRERANVLIRMSPREREGLNRRAAAVGVPQIIYFRRMLGLCDEIQENDPDDPHRPPPEGPPRIKDFRSHPPTD